VVQDRAVGDPAAVVPTAAPHTAPSPPPATPIPMHVTLSGAPLASPIVGVRRPLARTDWVFEACGDGALQGVGFSIRGGAGGGRTGARWCLLYGSRHDL